MFAAFPSNMALRTFIGSDGQRWTAWVTRPGTVARWIGAPEAWLVFQNEDDTERRRLMDIPPNWESLSDSRLDLLRRVSEPVALYIHRHSPPSGVRRSSLPKDDSEGE